MTDRLAEVDDCADSAAPSRSFRRSLALPLLLGAGAASSFTTSIMGVILVPIQKEFGLTDSNLGLLVNTGFGLGIVITALPAGYLIDRSSRKIALVLALFFAGLVTGLGVFGGVLGILMTRTMSGAFHAPCGPAVTSMLTDLYPAERRAAAMSAYIVALIAGNVLNYLIGGYVAGHYGWRGVLVLGGAASAVVGAILMPLLQEPDQSRERPKTSAAEIPSLMPTLKFIWQQRAVVHVIAACVLGITTMSATMVWLVPFYVRLFDFTLSQAGTAVGLGAVGVCGFGALIGGFVTDKLSRRDQRWKTGVPAVAIAISSLAVILMVTVHSIYWAIALMVLWSSCIQVHIGPAWAVSQSLVPPRMRGRAATILSSTPTLLGVGLGPALAGGLSQLLIPHFGYQSIRYALGGVNLLNVVVIFWYLVAMRYMRADQARLDLYLGKSATPSASF